MAYAADMSERPSQVIDRVPTDVSPYERHLPFDLQVSRNVPLRHINPCGARYERKGLIAICKSHTEPRRRVYATVYITRAVARVRKHTRKRKRVRHILRFAGFDLYVRTYVCITRHVGVTLFIYRATVWGERKRGREGSERIY